MEQTPKSTLIIAIVVILAILGVTVWLSMQTTEQPAPVVTPMPKTSIQAQAEVPSETITIAPKDTTDATITTDLSSIDTQLTGLSQDSATVGGGLTTSAAAEQY